MKYAQYTNAALNKIGRDKERKGGNNKNNSDVFIAQLRDNSDLNNLNAEKTSRKIIQNNANKNFYQSQVSFKYAGIDNSTI